MLKWVVTLTSKRPAAMKRSTFNNVMRMGMFHAGLLWIHKYLPLHFGNSAVSRYGYNFRSGAWHQIKNILSAEGRRPARPDESLLGRPDARVIRNGKYVVWTVPGHFENEVNYWHGDMKKMVLSNAQSGAMASRIVTRATEDNYTVRVPVQIPHAVQPKYKGEIVKRTANETKDMAAEITRTIKSLFGLSVETKVERFVVPIK